jgi:Ca-activated chloride channel family protein
MDTLRRLVAAWNAIDWEPWLARLRQAMPFLLVALASGLAAGAYGFFYAERAFHLARPMGLWALVVWLPLSWWLWLRPETRRATFLFSRVGPLGSVSQGALSFFAELPRALRLVALGLLAVALARPRIEAPISEVDVEGIDIVVVLDLSLSMEEHDLLPNRLQAAKRVLDNFVARRPNDRIGLTVFGREAFTQCPLTLDHAALRELIRGLDLGTIDGRGTAIGDGLGVALNRLRRSDADTKVIILLTDGDNNSGRLSPPYAARLAQSLHVKIFTILMGRPELQAPPEADGGADPLLANRQRHPVNPKLLEEIASVTGGTPYLATDTASLATRFHAILEELDKSSLRDRGELYTDAADRFIWPALALLLLEVVLSLTRFRRFP